MYPHCSLKPRSAEQGIALSWRVLFTPFSEFQVEADLIEMGRKRGLAIDAYCPAMTKWSKPPESPRLRHRHRPVRIQLPLYPGYLFVGLGPDHDGILPYSAVMDVRSDMEWVRSGGRPARFPYASPRLHLDALMRQEGDLPVTVFGLRLQENFKAFDFTRDRKKAAAAVRRAQLTFKSFAEFGQFANGQLAA